MDKSCKHGHTSGRRANGQCIECSRLASAKWNASHKDEQAIRMKEYHAQHPEAHRKANKEYYLRNRDRILSEITCKKYHITKEDYNRRLDEQGHVCSLCKQPFDLGKQLSPCVDHDHLTKRVRGIIHNRCNLMLGFATDDPTRLKQGIEYLTRVVS